MNEQKDWSELDDIGAAHMPTEEEIRKACEEFQKTWSPQERRTRSGGYDKRDTYDNVEFKVF